MTYLYISIPHRIQSGKCLNSWNAKAASKNFLKAPHVTEAAASVKQTRSKYIVGSELDNLAFSSYLSLIKP